MAEPAIQKSESQTSRSPAEREAEVRRLVEMGEVKGDTSLIAFREPTEAEKATAAKLGEQLQNSRSTRGPAAA